MIKKQFALIGYPIEHTISPFIHNRLFELNKIKAEYKILKVTSENLKDVYKNILKNLDGYNVTIPNKIEILNFLNKTDLSAKNCASVNTVKNHNNLSIGFNTDGNGFLNSIKNSKIKLGGNIVILGAGGAARAISYSCAKYAKTLKIAVRKTSLNKATYIANNLKNICNITEVTSINDIKGQIDVLINATPIGMFPNQDMLPINENILKNCKYVFDAIYNPYETLLLKKAKANGSTILGGLNMLVWQAVFAQKIWNDINFKNEDIYELIEDSKKELLRKFYGE